MNENPKWQVARLDDIERRGRTIPVREHLGIHGFGLNAFTPNEDGVLINEHDESGGQEELYVVLDGNATFEIDGETVDAPAGTFLYVAPEARRKATGEGPSSRSGERPARRTRASTGARRGRSRAHRWRRTESKRYADALAAVREGLEQSPDNAGLQLQLRLLRGTGRRHERRDVRPSPAVGRALPVVPRASAQRHGPHRRARRPALRGGSPLNARELTLPFAWYSDEEQLRRERARIFARSWQYAGRAEQVAAPGSFLAADAGGIPVLVDARHSRASCTRSSTSAGTAARCSPRAAEHGRRSSATTTRGRTTSTARCARRRGPSASPSFDPADWSLLPASVGTWGPFLFVNPDPEAPPLEEHLGDLPEILARDIDLDGLTFHSRVDFGSNANWKIVVENFLECYHCPTAHPGFSAEVDVHPDRYLLEAHPTFAAQFATREADRRARPVPPPLPEHRHQRLPRPREPLDRADRAERHRPDRALPRLLLRARRRPGVARASSSHFDDQVGREDTALVESVHRGMASGMLEHGRLLLNAEPLLAAFQSWVTESIR